MPRLDQMTQGAVQGFSFSGARPERLGASEYTLATIVVDVTGSVGGFESALRACALAAIGACRKSPRSENMLVRLVAFNQTPQEIFGFLPLSDIDDSMVALPTPGGGTALIDAIYSCAAASNAYGKQLADQDYLINSVSFVVTDGDDSCSRMSTAMAAAEVEAGTQAEYIDSAPNELIGINAARFAATLGGLAKDLGLAGYVDAGIADEAALAKVARFISQSISMASQSLGSGSIPAGVSLGLVAP
jgi:uncharacterized protein YegL